MNTGQTVFRQLLQFFPRHEFNSCVNRYHGEYRTRGFSTFDQFLCLAYGQLASRESRSSRVQFYSQVRGRLSTPVTASTSH
ncbi:MAG: DUF4372 domain-containing protein, partial [bacterium]|nr:DUF4372 domain-containing protein [bacterium]